MHYIYKITNIDNGKVYIGQTNSPDLRWSQHKSNAKHNTRPNEVLCRAIIKYTPEKFLFEVIATCKTQEDTDELEIEAIAQYKSCDGEFGYNILPGGNKMVHTPEIRAKMSIGIRKHWETHEHPMKGIPLTEEHKKNISIGSMGKDGTNTGKTFDNEWVMGISKSLAGKPLISNRKFSEEVEKEICRLYKDEGDSTYHLGQKFKCQRDTIRTILIRNNITIRHSNYTGHSNGCNIFTSEQEKEICDIYLAGKTSRAELSRKFGCGKTTIRDVLIRNKVKL
jgi:group I intron endonuclease